MSLLELVVATAIVAVLFAIGTPAVQRAREAARTMQCKRRLTQIGLALHNFESQFQTFPAGNDISKKCGHSWCTRILPMLDQASLCQGYNWVKPWNDASGAIGFSNKGVTSVAVPQFICPSTPTTRPGATDYGGNFGTTLTGLRAGFGIGQGWESGALLVIGSRGRTTPARLGEFRDGLSQVITIYECAGRTSKSGFWGAGTNCMAIEYPVNNHPDGETVMSYHPGGGHVLFADGHVAFVANGTDLNLLGRLATRNGGEVVESSF